jgi:hypothetical protein
MIISGIKFSTSVSCAVEVGSNVISGEEEAKGVDDWLGEGAKLWVGEGETIGIKVDDVLGEAVEDGLKVGKGLEEVEEVGVAVDTVKLTI